MPFELFMHHIDFCSFFFVLTCSLPLVFLSIFVGSVFCVSVLILAPCLGRLELIGLPPFPLCLPLGVRCLGMTVAERFLRN